MIVSILFFEMSLGAALWTGLLAGMAYSGGSLVQCRRRRRPCCPVVPLPHLLRRRSASMLAIFLTPPRIPLTNARSDGAPHVPFPLHGHAPPGRAAGGGAPRAGAGGGGAGRAGSRSKRLRTAHRRSRVSGPDVERTLAGHVRCLPGAATQLRPARILCTVAVLLCTAKGAGRPPAPSPLYSALYKQTLRPVFCLVCLFQAAPYPAPPPVSPLVLCSAPVFTWLLKSCSPLTPSCTPNKHPHSLSKTLPPSFNTNRPAPALAWCVLQTQCKTR